MEEFCESGCHLRFSHQSWAGQCETIRFRAIFNFFWSSILASLLWQHVLDPKPRNYILARCLPFSPTMPRNGQGVDHNQQRCLMAQKKVHNEQIGSLTNAAKLVHRHPYWNSPKLFVPSGDHMDGLKVYMQIVETDLPKNWALNLRYLKSETYRYHWPTFDPWPLGKIAGLQLSW
jgi:hypothetical protein